MQQLGMKFEKPMQQLSIKKENGKENGKETHLKSTKPQQRQRRNPSLGKPGRRRLRRRT